MRHYLQRALFILLFSCLAFIHPAQSLALVNKAPTDEVVLTAASYSAETDAAHITTPTIFPVHAGRQADLLALAIKPMPTRLLPYIAYDPPLRTTCESIGFLMVRHYQTNYLPVSLA